MNVGAVDQEIKPSLEELQQFRARLNVERSEEEEEAMTMKTMEETCRILLVAR